MSLKIIMKELRLSPLFKRSYSVLASSKSNQTDASSSKLLLNPRKMAPVLAMQPTARIFEEVDVSKMEKFIPGKGNLVYVGTMAPIVRMVKVFSLTTSAIGLAAQPVFYTKVVGTLPLALKFVMGGTFGCLIFITPLLLHWITGRYIIKMYLDYKTDTFTVSNFTLFAREKEMKFTPDQVKYPQIPGLLTSFQVNKKAMFLDTSLFLDINAYVKLMGYDKPIDWTFPSAEQGEEKK